MELSDMARRVISHHRVLIILSTVVFAALLLGVATFRSPGFVASARLVLTAPELGDTEVATSTADAAEAIVTSPGVVTDVLHDIGIDRDVVELSTNHIRVHAIGSSGILELAVDDEDPQVAATIANALVDKLTAAWGPTAGGGTAEAISVIQGRINALAPMIAGLQQKVTRLGLELDVAVDTATRSQLIARRASLDQRRAGLEQQRVLLQSQLGTLLVDEATQMQPHVIDRAQVPTEADATNAIPAVALGAMLGLLIGLAAAAGIESLHPSLVGADAVADSLGVPVLGVMSDARDDGEREWTAMQIRLAAAASNCSIVELIAIGDNLAAGWTQALAFPRGLPGSKQNGNDADPTLSVFGSNGTVALARDGSGTVGLVALTPDVVKRSDLRVIQDIRRVTSWPLLGVVVFTSSWRRHHRISPSVEIPQPV